MDDESRGPDEIKAGSSFFIHIHTYFIKLKKLSYCLCAIKCVEFGYKNRRKLFFFFSLLLPGHCIEEHIVEHYSIKWPGFEHVNQTASCLLSGHIQQKSVCGKTGSFSYLLSESVAISFLPPKRIWHWERYERNDNGFPRNTSFFKPHWAHC